MMDIKSKLKFCAVAIVLASAGGVAYHVAPVEAVLTEIPRVDIEYAYIEARDFHEGLAAVKSHDAWGYIDNLGHVIIPFVYRIPEAGNFSEGLAFVGDRYIDVDGNPAFERTFQGGREFSQGVAAVQSGAQWGFINPEGEFAIAPSFEAAGSFSSAEDCDGEPLAPVRKNGLWGYVDKSGNVKITPKYLRARPFSEGRAAVELSPSGRWGYIDSQDHQCIGASFDQAGEFKYGIAPVKRAKSNYRAWGFINKDGKLVIPHRYNNALSFSEGTAAVATDARWGFINVNGDKILSNQYDEARSFSEGLAAVRQDQYWGYIRQW